MKKFLSIIFTLLTISLCSYLLFPISNTYASSPSTNDVPHEKISTVDYTEGNQSMNLLLIKSVENNNLEMVQTAIINGANVNIYYHIKDATPLLAAIRTSNWNMMNYLLEQGADPNVLITKNGNLEPLLFIGWLTNNETPFDVYNTLIKHGLNIYTFSSSSESILTAIVNSGHQSEKYTEEAVKYFILENADVNHRNSDGNTPLHFAAQNGYTKITQILLDSGADPNLKNNKFQKPLDLAILNGNENLINLLMKKTSK